MIRSMSDLNQKDKDLVNISNKRRENDEIKPNL